MLDFKRINDKQDKRLAKYRAKGLPMATKINRLRYYREVSA